MRYRTSVQESASLRRAASCESVSGLVEQVERADSEIIGGEEREADMVICVRDVRGKGRRVSFTSR
jgi:hypothetical protein